MKERENTLQIQQINREWSYEHEVPIFPSLLGHSPLIWAGLPHLSTKLEHSPQEINHYINANIRTL
jgi:hypothetical protein